VVDDDDSRGVVDELLERGLLGRVEAADDRLWTDCDLASLAEHRLGDTTDPRALDDARRRAWEERATDESPVEPSERESWGTRCFWLLETGKPVGTIALASSAQGSTLLRMSSLYVFREHRGRGIGAHALQAVLDALGRHGLGMRFDTSWTWHGTVRWYLRRGMWVRMWKRDLEFCRSLAMPAPVFTFEQNRASVGARIDGDLVELVVAQRDGEVLTSFEETTPDERTQQVSWLADSTLSLALALRGWPLVRPGKSAERWCGDAGPPEALACRIARWEAWYEKHGWQSTAPRIPGLRYVDWEDV
jgi:GNAT superfamily N-acetyltransferase